MKYSEEYGDFPTIVIDNGSDKIKAGFANDDAPRCVLPTVIGRPRVQVAKKGSADFYIGDEAEARRTILTCKHPVEHGIICNWEDMQLVWNYVFEKELRRSPSESAVLLTEDALQPRACREKSAQVMFETFNTPAFYLASKSTLALYSYGQTTGLSVDSGVSTMVVPVYEGATIPHAIPRFNVGGNDLTYRLVSLLQERGYQFATTEECRHVREMKQRFCYIALDYDDELTKEHSPKEYTMPDGRTISLGPECFRCPEALFQEHLLGNERYGLHEAIDISVRRCDEDLRPELLRDVLLTGANTMFPGIVDRLKKELVKLYPDQRVDVRACPERKFSVWIGGSIFASLESFRHQCILKSEYDEFGPTIVDRKCRP